MPNTTPTELPEASEARTIDVGGNLQVTDYLCGKTVYRVDWDGSVWSTYAQFDNVGNWEPDEACFIPVAL